MERIKITQAKFDFLVAYLPALINQMGKDGAHNELSKIIERIQFTDEEVLFLKSIIDAKELKG